jgi:hypothetical protein
MGRTADIPLAIHHGHCLEAVTRQPELPSQDTVSAAEGQTPDAHASAGAAWDDPSFGQ